MKLRFNWLYDVTYLQMVVVLKKLTYGALLSPSEAAEEFRDGIIRCFRELLLSICVCSNESCSCKEINGWPALLARRDWEPPLTRISKYDSEPEDCLVLFLQSQTSSAAVGHWLSLLLKVCFFFLLNASPALLRQFMLLRSSNSNSTSFFFFFHLSRLLLVQIFLFFLWLYLNFGFCW